MAVQPLQAPFIDAARVHQGMEIYDNQGAWVGTVSEVWAEVHPYGYLAKSRFGFASYGPVRGTDHLFEGADGYMQVRRTRGIRRENEQDLYIPLNAVRDLDSGEALSLTCTEETCSIRFLRQPETV